VPARTPRATLSTVLATPVLACALAGPALAQRDYSQVEIEPARVAGGVWMLTGAGGNLGVCAGPDGVFLIDDQFAPLTPKIKAAIATFSDRPVRFVLNTHHHGDHTGGNENLAGEGAVVVAQDNVRRRMGREEFNALWGAATPASPPAALPIVTFSDTVTFHLNGHTVRCAHVANAHTEGDAPVHFVEANVVHSGDLLFNGSYPVIDYPAGGSIDGMIAAANVLLAMSDEDTRIIPGHGPLATRGDVVRFREMLVTVRDRVRRLVAQGRTLEQVLAARPLDDLDAVWGQGFVQQEMMLKQAFGSLARRRGR
jgi:glyoxylase-like metal-dependent hydrolase (beta-lactamase superfamily II)